MKAMAVAPSVITVALLGVVAACAESPPVPEVAMAVPGQLDADGALHFASPEEFFDAVDAVSRLNHDELDAWERALGFESMRRGFAELEARLEASTTPEERTALLAANADVIDPDSAELTRRVPAAGYAALIDRRGILYIDGVVHKVTTTHVLTSLDGNARTLAGWQGGLVHQQQPILDLPGVEAFQYVGADAARVRESSATGAQVCGSSRNGEKTTSDRRVKYKTRTFTFKTVTAIGDRQYRYRIEWEFWGYKKFLGSWISYKTTYQMYDSGIEMDVLHVTSYDGVRHQYDHETREYLFTNYDSGAELQYAVAGHFAGDTVQNVDESALPPPSFRKLHQETTSRGTSPARGIMECNYCGDGTCQPTVGEDAQSCLIDCGYCGDGICFGSESSSTCYTDCHCGDGICDSNESACNCGQDCFPGSSAQIEPPCEMPN